ncbi:hypothetical protein BHE74_00053301 [Ensete ventricosum]|nr:hypothetical protein GW17_00047985 [Ensete ventricosum]RWW41224.1 hypothetical protein BHE74_00053301 [Ensete ventricosum]RZR99113.1 hypothetical protein BHM03_00028628 [Ensete ventricosum]
MEPHFDLVPSPAAGAHTIGQARCTSFRSHIYNDTNVDASFAKTRRSDCPRATSSGDNNLAPLDLRTPTRFDNSYYNNLINFEGLLHTDQQLYNISGSVSSVVKAYSGSTNTFFSDFVSGMINMGDIRPLTGSKGEIRRNCRKTN